jgi:glycosyltransferase involved in cell wall biosynthesis
MADRADLIFTTAPALQRRFHAWAPGKTHFLPNVADYEHFRKAAGALPIPPDIASIPRPRIGFVGAIADYKVDFNLVARIAQRRPEWHWVLIGKVGEGQPGTNVDKLSAPNIRLMGPRPYEDLPTYLAHFDVVVLPCPLNDYTQSMFPMKFFEYLAAGKPVVSTRLDALLGFSQACMLAQDADEFEDFLAMSIAGQGPEPAACDALARQHTWETRMASMLAVLEAE